MGSESKRLFGHDEEMKRELNRMQDWFEMEIWAHLPFLFVYGRNSSSSSNIQ
jgi:hypothetical protein